MSIDVHDSFGRVQLCCDVKDACMHARILNLFHFNKCNFNLTLFYLGEFNLLWFNEFNAVHDDSCLLAVLGQTKVPEPLV